MPKTKFPAVVDLSSLNGINGFKINGEAANDQSGKVVSNAGDINGDGLDDLMIGASFADPNSKDKAGSTYIVFGHDGAWPSVLELSALNGETGFKVKGETIGDESGFSVSNAGDVNQDGFDDLIIGARYAESSDETLNAGTSYIVFGHNNTWPNALNLYNLYNELGVKIYGEDYSDHSGYSVSNVKDINGDGIADIVIGADAADPGGRNSAGSSYVVFGHSGEWPSPLELSVLDGATGFQINGELAWDRSGFSVSGIGDINGDGFSDLIIGAPQAAPNGDYSGSSYVIFGHHGPWSNPLELSVLNGTTGFKINGEAQNDRSGTSVSGIGDINGDGFDDIIIGAPSAEVNGKYSAGSSYVIFGHNGTWPSALELSSLDGVIGLKINGEAAEDNSGCSVSGAGDVNHDGINDLIIGAEGADFEGKSGTGASYVVFGHHGAWPSELELSSLDGTIGFKITGETKNDYSGRSVSNTGDVNGDGIDDLIIGAYFANSNGKSATGSSYVVFGDVSVEFVVNQLAIHEGEMLNITLSNLKVIDDVHDQIWFVISGLTNGYFEDISDVGTSITAFTQEAIVNGQIRFVHDGSEFPPAYNVTIHTEKLAYSAPEPAVISFTYINDAPVVMTTVSPLIYVENDVSVIDEGLTITDPDNVDLVNATVAITNNFHSDQDVLDFIDQHGISGVYDDVTGVLTLTGVSSLENYQIALQNITYQNLSDDPIAATRTAAFMVHDGFESSLSATRDVYIIPFNDKPVLAATNNTPLNYTENSVIAIEPDIIVFDLDNVHLVNATIAITNHFYEGQDILGFTNQNNITGIYNNTLGVLTLTGSASVEDYQLALRNVTYENLSEDPATVTRTVLFRVAENNAISDPVTRDINILPVNDCPVVTGNSGILTYTENDPAVEIDNSVIIEDFDDTQLTNGTVAITGHFNPTQDVLVFTNQHGISGSYSDETGILTLTGTTSLADYQTALRTVSYENLSDNPTTDMRTVSFAVSDGDCKSNIITRDIQIIIENERPVLVNNRLTITEGQNVTLTSSELSATDIDCDEGDLVFTVNTVQRGQFKSVYTPQKLTSFAQRNVTQGDVYFLHDGSSNAPSYFVRVSDGELTNIDGFQPASVAFIPANDPPIITHNQLNIYRGQHKYLTNTDLSATDEETSDVDLIFNISNIQHGYFEDTLIATQVTTFIQNKISQTDIRFVHDGSDQAPRYAVSVSDDIHTTLPIEAVINFIPKDPTIITGESDGVFDNPLYRALLIGGISGFIGLIFLVVRICLYRKATKSLERLTEKSQIGTTMKQQKEFQKNVLRPVAKAIFDRIKITGCLDYISDNRIQDYLDAVMKIIVELDQQNVNVDLEKLMPAGQSLLVNEIARQTQRVLIPQQACCSCGNCMRCIGKLCAAEVSPESIERNARGIALAVKTSLQHNNFDSFLARQTVIDVHDVYVDADVVEPEPALDMRTLEMQPMINAPLPDESPVLEMPIRFASYNAAVPAMPMKTVAPSYAANAMVSHHPLFSRPVGEERLQISSFSKGLEKRGVLQQQRMIPQ